MLGRARLSGPAGPLIGAAFGLLVGVAVTLLVDSTYRADASIGEWTVADVEQLLADQGDGFPELREELEIYLDSFRTVAADDGRLPGDVGFVIEDVFAPLIERARQQETTPDQQPTRVVRKRPSCGGAAVRYDGGRPSTRREDQPHLRS
jgi:hypothetical protein